MSTIFFLKTVNCSLEDPDQRRKILSRFSLDFLLILVKDFLAVMEITALKLAQAKNLVYVALRHLN